MVERKSTEELEKMTKEELAYYARDRHGISVITSAYARKSDIIKWLARMELQKALEEEADL